MGQGVGAGALRAAGSSGEDVCYFSAPRFWPAPSALAGEVESRLPQGFSAVLGGFWLVHFFSLFIKRFIISQRRKVLYFPHSPSLSRSHGRDF